MLISFDIVDPEIKTYLESCARIRDISVGTLLNEVLRKACADQLITAVLDDDSKPYPAKRGQKRFHPL